jgi:transketolase
VLGRSIPIQAVRALRLAGVLSKGHRQGALIALEDALATIWERFLRFDPEDPLWPDRDRFVLAADPTWRAFRRTLELAEIRPVNAGYARLGELALGTREPSMSSPSTFVALERSARMAVASRWMSQRFNRPHAMLFDHAIVALAGDDIVRAAAAELASLKRTIALAGSLQLRNLCWVAIVDRPIPKNVTILFRREGWTLIRLPSARDPGRLHCALRTARASSSSPTLILVINDVADHERTELVFDPTPLRARGRSLADEWYRKRENYRLHHPDLAAELDGAPPEWSDDLSLRCFSPF